MKISSKEISEEIQRIGEQIWALDRLIAQFRRESHLIELSIDIGAILEAEKEKLQQGLSIYNAYINRSCP